MLDVVDEVGLAGDLRVPERSTILDALSRYEPSMSLDQLDDPVPVGRIACEDATMGTIRGEMMTRHAGATRTSPAFDAIDASSDLPAET